MTELVNDGSLQSYIGSPLESVAVKFKLASLTFKHASSTTVTIITLLLYLQSLNV